MDINDFWHFVLKANYIGNNFSYKDSIQSLINAGYQLSDFLEAQTIFNTKKKELFDSIKDNNIAIPIGDDAQDDLISFVIGSGESKYSRFLNNPQKFLSYNNDNFIPESFSYVFQVNESDFNHSQDDNINSVIANMETKTLNAFFNTNVDVKQLIAQELQKRGIES